MFSTLLQIVALTAAVLSSTPTIEPIDGGFKVLFQPGAVWSCTTFRMTEPTEPKSGPFPDGYYAPKKCFFIDDEQIGYLVNWQFINKPDGSNYDVDWDVFAEVTYVDHEGNVKDVKSNVVRTHK